MKNLLIQNETLIQYKWDDWRIYFNKDELNRANAEFNETSIQYKWDDWIIYFNKDELNRANAEFLSNKIKNWEL